MSLSPDYTDRNGRHPLFSALRVALRFYPIVLSVAGTACLTISSYSAVQHRDWWLDVGVVSLLLGSAIAAKEIGVVGKLRDLNGTLSKRLFLQRNRRVFLISASLSDNEWQSAFIQGLLYGLIAREYEVTVYVPGQQFHGGEQDAHMRRVSANREEYAGGILISMFSEARREEIKRFADTICLPLVIHDNIQQVVPQHVKYVGILSSETGKLAGKAAVEIGRARNCLSKVLVLAGMEQRDRQTEFEIAVKLVFREAEVQIDHTVEFDRDRAEAQTTFHVSKSIADGVPFDIIFCTSDAMTLGCLEALHKFSFPDPMARPRVIGHDGTASVIRAFLEKDDFLAAVIVTEPRPLADRTVATLYNLIQDLEADHHWATPFIYPPGKLSGR